MNAKAATSQHPIKLYIHGDNVVECDRALCHVRKALGLALDWDIGSDPRSPRFAGISEDKTPVTIQLLPGHNRWGYDIPSTLKHLGATIRENADAVITMETPRGQCIVLAMEFCGALPAGNNSWQRHGRAYAFGQAGVPYLIYSEIGGVELDHDRSIKNARYPNPVIPFSFVALTRQIGTPVLPVYEIAPSAGYGTHAIYAEALGSQAAQDFIRAALLGQDLTAETLRLEQHALTMTKLLTERRKSTDGFDSDEWGNLFASEGSLSDFYLATGKGWRGRGSSKVAATEASRKLMSMLQDLKPVAIATETLPFFMIRESSGPMLLDLIAETYPGIRSEVSRWLQGVSGSVALVLVTGFKPGGSDSRPDRGLVPLARMLLGRDVPIFAIVWGPARARMVETLAEDPARAIQANGLLQAISTCGDAMILDSVHSRPVFIDMGGSTSEISSKVPVVYGEFVQPPAGEHDVDSIFHYLTAVPERKGVFEGMCNPPGGDWSGVNLLLTDGTVGRWTSLPRVSSAKRPDHVVQLTTSSEELILSVESKRTFRDLEVNVGPRLTEYLSTLMARGPGIVQGENPDSWLLAGELYAAPVTLPVYSLAIAMDSGGMTLKRVQSKYDLDFVMLMSVTSRNELQIEATCRSGLDDKLVEVVELIVTQSDIRSKVRIN